MKNLFIVLALSMGIFTAPESLAVMRTNIVPRGVVQKVAHSAVSAASAAFASTTKVIRVVSDQNCFVVFGSAPTADANGIYIVAGRPEFFGVAAGEKVAVIRSTVDGTLWISEGPI